MATDRAASSPTRILTAATAFVVHVTSDPSGDTTTGRVEHVTSGAAAHFATTAELVGFMHRTLAASASS